MLRLNAEKLLPDRKVIRAVEYQAYLDSTALIAEAQAEAARIREAAQQEFEAQKAQGYEEGLLEGKMQMAEKMVDGVTKAVEYFTAIEEQVVNLVIKSLEKILGDFDDRDLVVRIVRNILSLARNQRVVTVRVRPEDASAVKQRVHELLQGHPMISHLQIEPDPRLGRGGCILETDMGVVDASVDVQMEAIRKSLTRSVKGK